MKVLLVNGSPHKEGATFTALSEVARALEENGITSEIMWLGVNPIPGCIGCGTCLKTGKCFRNDIVNDFLEKMDEYDGFVFGSAVHLSASSGAISSFMDRVYYGRGSRFAFKPAAAVVSCRRGGATAAFDEINKYFSISQMPIVSSQYWNQIHGNNAEEAKQDLEGIQTMRVLGNNMAFLLKCLEVGSKNGVEKPEIESKVKTNFIR